MKKIFHKEVNTPNGLRVTIESFTRNKGVGTSYIIRYTIHTVMKLINRISGYRIWKKGEVPEIG